MFMSLMTMILIVKVANFFADLETTNMLGDENITSESVLDVPWDKSTTSFTLTKVVKEDGEISTHNGDIFENTKLGKQGP